MKYLLQFTTTEPDKWQTVEATNREAAIIKIERLSTVLCLTEH